MVSIMKAQALAAGLRLTLSKTELETLLILARYGADRLRDDGRSLFLLTRKQENIAVDLVHGLETGLTSVRWKQAEAKARRDEPKREAERRAAREHHAQIDGYTILGLLGDWADVSPDPDRRQWADLYHSDTRPRDQGELRRNVWRIYITKGSASSDGFVVLPGDCTMTADRDEIAVLARRIIADTSH
ncbi:hypothetical protein [Sphingobium sp. CFD-2]|uniref:hypothetical protein n=2 Tax=Sphingobium TaxID=165695 RepID=UPI001DE39546|nr:hypothetical protein [Sphingobium sp. CFD-2]TNE43768.1 MAG: hypothetical protein EP345_03820 [Sphingomonadales bacterium]